MANRSRARRRQGSAVEFNMTPMIDVTFQLIIFFIIAGSVASEELVENIEVPQPLKSQALEIKDQQSRNRVLVNVISVALDLEQRELPADPYKAKQVLEYQIGSTKFAPGRIDTMQAELRRRIEAVPEDQRAEFSLEVRADRRVRYSGVAPVIAAAGNVGISKMNITAKVH